MQSLSNQAPFYNIGGIELTIKTNRELAQAVNDAIKESGIKKIVLAEKIGLTRQGLDKLLQKQSFSLDDANKILNVIHLSVSAKMNK